MARLPSGADKKLKEAGRRLLMKKGLTGFTLREACRMAGVNTGMFRYYFGSKDEFLRAVMKEMYAEFMVHFKAGVSSAGSPREKLKSALMEVGRFARALRRVAPVMLADLAHANREAFSFISGNFTEHAVQISALAAECRPVSALKGHSVPYMVGTLVPVMVFPVIMGGIMERNGVKELGGVKMSGLMEEFLSEKGIADRAEMALKGAGL